MKKRQMKKLGVLVFILLVAQQALAASEINANIRLFEDTIWIGTFTLMLVFSLLMASFSASIINLGFKLLALTGLSGLAWKTIGVIKRVFNIDNPEWLFLITRETLEVFTGVVIGVAFLVLSFGFTQLFNSAKRQAQPSLYDNERELA